MGHTDGLELESSDVDRQCLRRLRRLVRLCLTSDNGRLRKQYSLFVALLCIGEVSVYFTGTLSGNFYRVLVDRNWAAFPRVLWQSSLIVITTALVGDLPHLPDVSKRAWLPLLAVQPVQAHGPVDS